MEVGVWLQFAELMQEIRAQGLSKIIPEASLFKATEMEGLHRRWGDAGIAFGWITGVNGYIFSTRVGRVEEARALAGLYSLRSPDADCRR